MGDFVGSTIRQTHKELVMSDRQRPTDEDVEQKTTDLGEGERGVTAPGRGGTFRPTPGEAGDKAEGESGGPSVKIPHRQNE
jgi:hypothetical protein